MTQTVQYVSSLTDFISPVYFQNNEGTCGPCMEYNVVNVMENLDGVHTAPVDTQALYNMNLITENSLGVDAGVSATGFMHNLSTIGVPTLNDIPYGPQSDGITPSAADYTDAATHLVTYTTISDFYAQTENGLSHTIASYLQQGKPVEMAFTVCQGLLNEVSEHSLSSQDGMNVGAIDGGHFADIVAINTNTNMLDIESWGGGAGANGLFQVSLDSFIQPITSSSYLQAANNLQGLFVETGFNGIDLTQNAVTSEVAQAFVGILNRAPALAGMQNYEAAINSGQSLANICDSLLQSAEGIADISPNATSTQFIDYIFQNVLGRAAAAGGLSYYSAELSAGESRGQVASEIITNGMDSKEWANGMWFGDGSLHSLNPSLYPTANPDPNIYNESLTFQNKVQGAQDFAITLQAGAGHSAQATAYIAGITADPGTVTATLIGVANQIHSPLTPVVI